MMTSFYLEPAIIVPAIGPLQALLTLLPHLLVLLGMGLLAFFKPATYRALFRYFRAHKAMTLVVVAAVSLSVWNLFRSNATAAQQQSATAWPAFRGGVMRCGATPGSTGPKTEPVALWNFQPDGSGLKEIDSSPAVANGNRVYFGVNGASPFKSWGAICCLDANTGANAWPRIYKGEDLPRPLLPVFSSPAIGGGPKDDEARYLVCGEGYHTDLNARLLCLDLQPVSASKGKESPKAVWAYTTTNHVESSPCIFEGKAYAGAGDDGWWCVEVATGLIKWRLESCSHYFAADTPKAAELAKLAGKNVVARGTVKRYKPDETQDFSIMVLDIQDFSEADPKDRTVAPPPPAVKLGEEPLRCVVGTVEIDEKPANKEAGASKVKLKMACFYPDAESEPLGVRLDKDGNAVEAGTPESTPCLFFGCGIDGEAAACVNAETGQQIWKVKTTYPAFGGPTFADGKVLFGLSNGTFDKTAGQPAGAVLCLKALTGEKLWEVPTRDGVLGAVAVKDGFAYACSKDQNVYVIPVVNGAPVTSFATGAPLTCGPAVTSDGVFVGTGAGKVFGLTRQSQTGMVSFAWSVNLTPGKAIFSSAAVSGDHLYLGSADRGVFCLAPDPKATANAPSRPWTAAGGSAQHAGLGDQRGPPGISEGGKAERLTEDGRITSRASGGPLAACGKHLYFGATDLSKPGSNLLACVDIDAKARREIWQVDVGGPIRALLADAAQVYISAEMGERFKLTALSAEKGTTVWSQENPQTPTAFALSGTSLFAQLGQSALVSLRSSDGTVQWKLELSKICGSPASIHGLLFVTLIDKRLLCLDDSSGMKLWDVELPAAPLGGPTVSAEKVFVAVAGKTAADAKIIARRLADGGKLWDCDVDKAPASHLSAGGMFLAFTAADGTVLGVNTSCGEQTHTVLLGAGGQAPVMAQNLLLLAADNRVGAYDLNTSSWVWGFREQDKIGRVLSPPVLAGEVLWLSTEKLGLIGVGAKAQ
ncbi:MAG TPA: PQQ-binding-like beta-propeller repeat protein [Planctomycetota bacterium]|jgi:outer membrane protein assembly factor BamB